MAKNIKEIISPYIIRTNCRRDIETLAQINVEYSIARRHGYKVRILKAAINDWLRRGS